MTSGRLSQLDRWALAVQNLGLRRTSLRFSRASFDEGPQEPTLPNPDGVAL